ncbi:hypothetical protein [Amycolatopsis magusensis]|nr:hypothetical protein [Amycolatopsis magusensis]MDI5974583.1 hypothetical protein [Amycolatopsis magusensis]
MLHRRFSGPATLDEVDRQVAVALLDPALEASEPGHCGELVRHGEVVPFD